MEQQIKDLQDQVRELTLAVQRRRDNDRTPPRYRPDDEYDSDEFSQAGDYNPYGRRSPNNRNHTDIKVDIPEYDGKLDPDEFVEWLRTVERVFDYKHTVEEKKVKLVALKLRKYASTWWANVCSQREKLGKEKVRSWSKMKKLLKSKFMPPYYLQESFSKLHFIKQGTRTIEEFSQEFEHLLMKCGLNPDDPQTLVRYLGGLEPRIANVVELHPYSTLAELTLMSHKVEAQQRTHGKLEVSKPVIKTIAPAPTPSSLTPTVPTPSKTIDLPESSTTTSKHSRRCFRCQGLGHIASECANKRVITLAEFESLTGPKFDEEPHQQHDANEVVLGPDEGDCLVIHRALNGAAVHSDKLQREALFRTRCTIRDKVCSLLIDGGSCTNVASQTLLSKLGLSTEPHPSPYDIHWLNHGRGIRVSTRVLITFSIGQEYKDEIWCDVIPMDACHVLLGRPWLFDRKVVHDGYKNTYSFVKDGRKITLLPLMSKNTLERRTLTANMFFKSSFQDVQKDNKLFQVGFKEQKIPGTRTNSELFWNTYGSAKTIPGEVDGGISIATLQIDITSTRKPAYEIGYLSLRANFLEDGEDDSGSDPGTKLNKLFKLAVDASLHEPGSVAEFGSITNDTSTHTWVKAGQLDGG
ncbi:uncharacterized protein LOC110864356 isoform X1 [Helianthus annuus]|uniref:uncharacterized protein LOC110864356 isoform X1 n=1 Tax=Helianthus annuus TaxID=4232 RepID=UPI000B8F21C0|nr:uncharacterized protein LOC110864356 isoform X1 [Helianthus annuus]